MKSGWVGFVMWIMAWGLAGCSASEPAKQPAAPNPTRASDGGARLPADAAPTPTPTPTIAKLGRPEGAPSEWGQWCNQQQECGWNDGCFPAACVVGASGPTECEESAPPPGTCECVARQCTLRPSDLARASTETGCKSDMECAVDPATASCYVVANPDGFNLQGPLYQEGPYCTCDLATQQCRYQWSARVPCQTFRECGWQHQPRLRPVPADKPRKRPVRPCQDSEVDSVCKDNGAGEKYCTIVSWSC